MCECARVGTGAEKESGGRRIARNPNTASQQVNQVSKKRRGKHGKSERKARERETRSGSTSVTVTREARRLWDVSQGPRAGIGERERGREKDGKGGESAVALINIDHKTREGDGEGKESNTDSSTCS